jgi:hypothetical protein
MSCPQFEIQEAIKHHKQIILIHETDERHGNFNFTVGMQEAPEHLKYILEDYESIPWRRRTWERQGVLRMIVEHTKDKKWLQFHDQQRRLLAKLHMGRRKSFLDEMSGTMSAQDPSGTADSSKRGSLVAEVTIDHKLSFARTFWIRLLIAISVTYACLWSVFSVRVSLNTFGPPDGCSPLEKRRNQCDCKFVLARCSYKLLDCISICDTAANTTTWNDLQHENPGWWDKQRSASTWVDLGVNPCATSGPGKNRPECTAFQYFKERGEREWCTRIQKQSLGMPQFGGVLDASTTTQRGAIRVWQEEHGCAVGEWLPPECSAVGAC